jgi:MraZ protein
VRSGTKWSAGNPAFLSFLAQVERMFLGQYRHSIDNKGRLIIPARFREFLDDGAYISQGFDRNLMVLRSSTFDGISRRLNQLSITDPAVRQLRRLIYSTADRIDFDRNGRILMPQFLRGVAQIETDAILVGVGDYFEIWAPEVWNGQLLQLQDADANAQRFTPFDLFSIE